MSQTKQDKYSNAVSNGTCKRWKMTYQRVSRRIRHGQSYLEFSFTSKMLLIILESLHPSKRRHYYQMTHCLIFFYLSWTWSSLLKLSNSSLSLFMSFSLPSLNWFNSCWCSLKRYNHQFKIIYIMIKYWSAKKKQFQNVSGHHVNNLFSTL